MRWRARTDRIGLVALLVGVSTVTASCSVHRWQVGEPAAAEPPPGAVTLALAGDVHFEQELADLLDDPRATLGPLSTSLASADLAVVNLETAVTTDLDPTRKELEDADDRYWFDAPPAALDVLARSGVDVVSMANNHGADHGVGGVRDSLRAADASSIEVLGIGADVDEAYAPLRTTVRGVDVALHAADASPLESRDDVWAARPGTGPGVADARGEGAELLLESVHESAADADLVVAYLHWGEEGSQCPTGGQRTLAQDLEEAGADVVVGAHAHLPQGAGLLGDAYVSYGLGNFLWYNGRNADTGVLELTVVDGEVVEESWVPGVFGRDGGQARPLAGDAAAEAVEAWEGLRGCTGLAAGPGAHDAGDVADLPRFEAEVDRIGPELRDRMTAHDPETCPVPLADLRHLTLPYVGFDGRAHVGEMVVAAEAAGDVVSVFRSLYRERFPIQTMQLIDEFDGDDDASMAANNTSGYNCRTVAGSTSWSDHAYGLAVDVNPVQNPYVVGDDVRPVAARPYVGVDRGAGAEAEPGVVVEGGPVLEAFERIGWTWGDSFEDYQHFADPAAP